MQSWPPVHTSAFRVLFVFSPTQPGADTWVQLLAARYLVQCGVEVHAAVQKPDRAAQPCATHSAVAAIPGVRIVGTDFGPSLYRRTRLAQVRSLPRYAPAVTGMLRLARYVRRHRIQIVHSTDRPRDTLANVLLGKLTGAKSVVHVHVKFAEWISRGVRIACGRADGLIAISDFVAQSLVDSGYEARRVHLARNAVDVRNWTARARASVDRATLGLPAEGPIVLCVARIFQSKGQQVLIDALPRVRAQFPEVRAVFVGDDYPPGCGVSAELTERARALGVADNVLFLGQRSDVAELLAACDVFCLPSIEEPFGLVFAEAMAMERPVVAVGDGGTTEIVEHGRSGLLAPAFDAEAIADHLLTLLGDPALGAELGQRGRADVQAHFDAPRLAQDLCGIYERLLAGAPSAWAAGT